MIIWSGWGIIVPFVAMIFFLIVQVLINVLMGEGYAFNNAWSLLFASMLSSTTLWVLGKKINSRSERILVNKISGRAIRAKSMHSFFFIPVQYWAFIFFGVGLIFVFLSMPSVTMI